jgi:hypothetical protein
LPIFVKVVVDLEHGLLIIPMQRCNRCNLEKPLTEEFFYALKARKKHPTDTWQSHCKECWREINKENKKKIKAKKKALSVESGLELIPDHTSAPSDQLISATPVPNTTAPNTETSTDADDDVTGSMMFVREYQIQDGLPE